MGLFIKTDDPQFAKDPASTAVLNTDVVGFNMFKQERDRILKLQQLSEDMICLQKEVCDIKQLLQQLINGRTND